MNDTVNIRSLKGIALRLSDPVKTLILSEPDILPKEEYFIKIEQWLKIIDLNKGEGSK